MILDRSQRRFLSRRAWQLYPAFYALGVYLGFASPLAIPLLVAVPLLGVAVLHTLFEWHGLRRAGLVACAVALGECALAWLLVLRQPGSLVTWAWGVAMIAPLALTVAMLRLSRRSRDLTSKGNDTQHTGR